MKSSEINSLSFGIVRVNQSNGKWLQFVLYLDTCFALADDNTHYLAP